MSALITCLPRLSGLLIAAVLLLTRVPACGALGASYLKLYAAVLEAVDVHNAHPRGYQDLTASLEALRRLGDTISMWDAHHQAMPFASWRSRNDNLAPKSAQEITDTANAWTCAWMGYNFLRRIDQLYVNECLQGPNGELDAALKDLPRALPRIFRQIYEETLLELVIGSPWGHDEPLVGLYRSLYTTCIGDRLQWWLP